MKSLITCLLCLISAASFSQTTQISDPNAKERKLTGTFTGIKVSSGVTLYLSEGKEQSIAVSTSDQKYEDRFITEIENGVLKIYFDNKGLNNNGKRKLTAYVSYTTLNKLHASAGANVKITGTISSNDLDLKASSGAVLKGKVQSKDLLIDQESGSIVELSGEAENVKVEVSSGSIFKGFNLQSEFCKAKASSGGVLKISINKELDADANSGGSIRYKGAAVIRDVDVSGGGVVKKA